MSRVEGYLPGTGIVRIEVADDRLSDVSVLDPAGDWDPGRAASGVLLPGLVDLQVNGYYGVDFGDEQLTVETILACVRSLWEVGVTAFCPTLITAPPERMARSLEILDAARGSGEPEAKSLLGAHLEGPWISPLDGARGAHPLEHVADPDVAVARRLLDAGVVAIVTLAPERPSAIALIRELRARGVVVSIGHSAADAVHIDPAIDAGATSSTHLGNGVPASLPRHPNLIWEQLSSGRTTAMFIADLHHLDAHTLRAMVRAKGEDRVVLVSDTTALAGLAPGRYSAWIGGEVDLDATGRLTIVGTPYLAGAALPLLAGLSNVLRHRLLSPGAAIRAVSNSPHTVLEGEMPRVSSPFRIGDPATFVRCSWDDGAGLTVVETVIAGRTVFGR